MSSSRIPEYYPAPGVSEVADAIRQRRGSDKLLELDGVLLHSPLLTQTCSTFMGSIRQKTKLPGDIRELIVSTPLRFLMLSYTFFVDDASCSFESC